MKIGSWVNRELSDDLGGIGRGSRYKNIMDVILKQLIKISFSTK